MQLILREDVENVGKMGEVVNVRDGFGRNYLIPRGLAVVATGRNVRQMQHEQKVIERQDVRRQQDAQAFKAKIEALSLTIAKNTGEDDKLFGAVTNREVAEALHEQGVEMDRKHIILEQPIKALGVYTVEIRLTREVKADLKVWVVAK
jgi:large subunit ribosomal protein L9